MTRAGDRGSRRVARSGYGNERLAQQWLRERGQCGGYVAPEHGAWIVNEKTWMTYAYSIGGALATVMGMSVAFSAISQQGEWIALTAPVGLYLFAQLGLRVELRKSGVRPRRSTLWFVP